eukprot:TRINITY_DN2220_c0_g2_i1.p1 TRINITY_DN2220_c0_g2~~TRINITY_DN2220_c0_g2_i1.p1  ORF type:complete len:306 (-),score=78.12 TRINITY_DN2220_c0_g2_i1:23-940(-)
MDNNTTAATTTTTTGEAKLKLALYQGGGVDKSHNLRIAAEVIRDAASHGAHLIVFPELFVNGYETGTNLVSGAEPITGPAITTISALAKANNIAVCVGYSEVEGPSTTSTTSASASEAVSVSGDSRPVVYNSAVLIGADGQVLLNYRKTHLWSQYEAKYFTSGSIMPPVVSVNGVKVTILICWDIEFPEPARVVALRGAELILVPTANVTALASEVMIKTRAFENDVFIAYANRVQNDFVGYSVIIAPDAVTLAEGSREKEELLYAEIAPHKAEYVEKDHRNPFFEARNLALYTDITTQTVPPTN